MAVSSGNRCAPGKCESTTITPAVVYFPAGTYLISSSIIDYYFTQIIGNPNSLPILRATPGFSGFGLIDGDQYQAGGVLGFGATNVLCVSLWSCETIGMFIGKSERLTVLLLLSYRQIRNFVFDMTDIPANQAATGVHWPTAQATSLQNCVFQMSDAPGTVHQGIFIESGKIRFIPFIKPFPCSKMKNII